MLMKKPILESRRNWELKILRNRSTGDIAGGGNLTARLDDRPSGNLGRCFRRLVLDG